MANELIAAAITEHYGERCPEFDADCFCCKAWGEYDALTRPAAPVEGLETVATVRLTTVYPSRNTSRVLREAFVCSENVKQSEELVTRSQAEAIIAAKDAEIKQLKADLQSHIDGTTALVDEKIDAEFKAVDLAKDNAALTALVKEFEAELQVCEAENNAKDTELETLKYQLRQVRLAQEREEREALTDIAISPEGISRAEALETKLAAAKKALEETRTIAWQRESLPPATANKDAQRGTAIALSGRLGEIINKTRAALEDRP